MRRHTLLVVALMLGLSLPAFGATVRVKANGTPLRSKSAAGSEVVARLEQGVVLELVDVVRDWYKVRDPRTNKEGFVLSSLVDLVPGDATAPSRETAEGRKEAGAQAAGGKARAPVPARRVVPPPKPGEWRDKGFVAASGVFQGAGQAFGYSFSPSEFAYAEEAHINTHHPLKSGPAFDAAGGVRVWRNLAVGAAVSVFSKSSTVTVDGTVPHPLYIDRDRQVSGTFASPRTEMGVHLQGTWVVPAGRRMFVSISGGPSYLHVEQAIASGINLSTVYPYDTTAVTGARTTTASKGSLGFNAGADVSYFFTRNIGMGAMVRFSRASVSFEAPGGDITTHAGGAQAGVGVRIRLMPAPARVPFRGPAKAPPPPPRAD